MKKIASLKIFESYRIWMCFDDGIEGEIDFSSKLRTGVFAFWDQYDNFRKAHIGEFGELVWNEEVAFCPDALWMQITGNEN